MNYEKKYKDLVKAVKELQEANPSDDGIQKWVKDNVPELMESEDEKIRKALVKHCREQADIYKTLQTAKEYNEVQSWIAWLEKQKDHEDELEKAYKTADEVQYRRGYEDAKREFEKQGEQKPQGKSAFEVWKDMRLEVYAQASGNRHEPNCSDDKTKMFSLSDIDEIIEKISEQKPVEWHREDEQNLNACLGFIPDEYLRRWLKDVIHVKYDKIADKVEQEYHCKGVREPKEATGVLKQLLNKENYAWSEKDEAYRVDILVKLEPHITDDNFTDVQNWFKSLKDRVQPQPTQEWSEEDDKIIKNIISVLDVQVCWDGATGKKMNPYQNEINWLKSLKEKYTWKPNEEQMDALETAISSLQSTALESLYDKLKNL